VNKRKLPFWAGDILWIACFLLVHLIVLFSIGSEIQFTEEIYNGRIAYRIINSGFDFNENMQFLPFAGGTFIEALLIIPAFKLFGYNIFALKIVPILFITGALWMWRIYFRNNFSLLTANMMSLLMVFSPPYLMKISCVAWGNHLESVLLLSTALVLMTKSFGQKRAGLWAFVLGLWSGFSIYFIMSYLVIIFAGSIVIGWRRLVCRFEYPWRLLGSGFLIGMVPWLCINIAWGFKGVRIFQTYNKVNEQFVYRLYHFFTVDLPTSTGFFSGYGKDVLIAGLIYWCFCLVIWSGVFAGSSDRECFSGSNIIWVYIILYSLAYASGSFRFKQVPSPFEFRSYRYLAPLYPMLFACVAIGFGGWIESGKKYFVKIVVVIYAFIIIASAVSVVKILKPVSMWDEVFQQRNFTEIQGYRMVKEYIPNEE